MKRQNIPLFAGIGIGVILFFVLVGVLLRNRPTSIAQVKPVNAIVLTNNGSQFSLDSSGNALWGVGEGMRSELWTHEKTKSFFDYYYATWASDSVVTGDTAYVTVNGTDELANVVTEGGSGGSGGGGGGDVSQYFTSPTPTPSGGAGGSGGSGDGGSGGGGGNNGGPSWCIHWRLSYCADPPAFTSNPTPTPQPTTGPTPLPPDCNNTGNQQTGRTVISNDLCLPTSTP